jgi:pimeloyl-ACP methyl ester carboxylesterase
MIPGGELRIYPESGHTPHWEQPADFARDVSEFIARAAAAP